MSKSHPEQWVVREVADRPDRSLVTALREFATTQIADCGGPGTAVAFTLPAAEHFAAAAGRLGIGDGIHVVAYAQDTPMWATRLWWLLRYFGHAGTSVLDGGLVAWTAAGGPVEPGESGYPPASFTARPRPELLPSLADVREITGTRSACLVNALSSEAFRGEGPGACLITG